MLHSEFIAGINNSGMLPDGLLDELLNTITSGAKKVYCSTGSQKLQMASRKTMPVQNFLAGYDDWMTWSGPPE